MYPKIYKISLILTITALVLGACQPAPPQPPSQPPTPAETPLPPSPSARPATPTSAISVIDDGSPLPPQVVWRQPDGAEELATGGTILLAFDQPMDAARTGAAFQVSAQDGKRGGANCFPTDEHWNLPTANWKAAAYMANLGPGGRRMCQKEPMTFSSSPPATANG
jgi:hypothetical protein